jgi:hypothetical protein
MVLSVASDSVDAGVVQLNVGRVAVGVAKVTCSIPLLVQFLVLSDMGTRSKHLVLHRAVGRKAYERSSGQDRWQRDIEWLCLGIRRSKPAVLLVSKLLNVTVR